MAATPRFIEDPRAYRFDLETEARNILRDYPNLDGHTLFVSLDDPAAVFGALREVPKSYHPLLPQVIDNCLNGALRQGCSMAYAEEIPDKLTGTSFPLNVIVMMPTPPAEDFTQQYERELRDYFVLNHEAGHLLLPLMPEAPHPRYPYVECLADAFATIRTIQKFGADDAIHNKLAASRALNFISSGVAKHLTTTVTDRIVDEAQRQDFTALDAHDAVRAAKIYADALTPQLASLVVAEENYEAVANYVRATPGYDRLHLFGLVGETCLSTADRFSFYLGAKLFQPLLHPDGVMLAQHGFILEPAQRQQLVENFIEKSRFFKLDALAAQFAENRQDAAPQLPETSAASPRKNPAPGPAAR